MTIRNNRLQRDDIASPVNNTITFTWEEALRAAHLPITRVVPQGEKPKPVIRAGVR